MKRGTFALCALAAAMSIIACLCIGPVMVPPGEVLGAIWSSLFGAGGTALEDVIAVQARLPRVILGFAIGCALALAGATLQGLVRNRLADPFVLEGSYGAAVATTAGMAAGWFAHLGIFQGPINGCIGALAAMAFVSLYATRRGRPDMDLLLLGGIGVSMFCRAAVQCVMKLNPHAFQTGSLAFWTEGGLAAVKLSYLRWPLLLIIACMASILVHYRQLNALECGEEAAGTLGVPVAWMQKLMILTVSAMVGVSVAISGGVGFVGLVAPNLARMLVGGDNRRVLPASAFLGGIFLIWCDVLARTLFSPIEVSVGIITSLIGGPVFLFLMKRLRAGRR